MYPFKSTQYDTFMALVQASNPGLDIAPLTIDQFRTLVPTAITADSFGRDTSVRLMVKPGNSKYYGTQTVTYRRINPATYFRGMTITLDDYLTTASMSFAQYATAMNNKYGTIFSSTDFPGAFSAGNGTAYASSSLPLTGTTSLIYNGFLPSFTWTKGKQYITQAITNPALAGKLYPGGNSFPSGRKPQGDFITYGLDFASIAATLKSLSASVQVTPALWATSPYSTILAYLQQQFPSQNFNASDSGTAGGLGNLILTRYTLPSASVPGANSAKFANVTTIAAVSGSWFQGLFYLHYN